MNNILPTVGLSTLLLMTPIGSEADPQPHAPVVKIINMTHFNMRVTIHGEHCPGAIHPRKGALCDSQFLDLGETGALRFPMPTQNKVVGFTVVNDYGEALSGYRPNGIWQGGVLLDNIRKYVIYCGVYKKAQPINAFAMRCDFENWGGSGRKSLAFMDPMEWGCEYEWGEKRPDHYEKFCQ